MPELGTSGSVRGAAGNGPPYRDRKPGLFVASLCERRPEGRILGGVDRTLELSVLRGEVADLRPRRR
jgi:hypothetical protein